MNTKEVCKALSITEKALRIYEAHGIITPGRESNNYRNYDEEDLLKLREIMLLKEIGFSLKEIKLLTDRNIYANNQFTRSLYLQYKALGCKLVELENIRNTLKESIDIMLESEKELGQERFLDNISETLEENKAGRRQWIDKWGFDNKAMKYDRMISNRSDDELGLFEKYDEIMEEIRDMIIEHRAEGVLDIGCGTGNLCGSLSSNINVVGMDQSLEMLLQAKKKYENMKLKLGNFLDKPYCTNHFDIVVSTFAFHTLSYEEKKIALSHMLEFLKENGKIIIGDFMFVNESERAKCKEKLLSKQKYALWEVIESRHYTDIERFAEYVRSLGLRIEYKHCVNFSWIVVIEKC